MRRRRSVAEQAAQTVQPAVKRNVSPLKATHQNGAQTHNDGLSSSSSMSLDDNLGAVLHAGNNSSAADTPAASTQVVEAAPAKRWKDWWIRLAMTAVMIVGCFTYVYTLRQAGVVLLIFALQTGIYRELVRIATVDGQERALPGFSYFYWYWFAVGTFFIYTWTLQPYLLSGLTGVPLVRPHTVTHLAMQGAMHKAYTAPRLEAQGSLDEIIGAALEAGNMARKAALWIVHEYVPIAFSLYCAGLIAFVFSLKRRRNFKYQFAQYAYCHIALLAVVFQSTFLCSLVFNGLIWFFIPVGTVVCNDSMAYVSGFFFGRTPLIRISPKKTVEGFVGGALATVVFAVAATGFWQSSDWAGTRHLMLCPVQSGFGNWGDSMACDTTSVAAGLFVPQPLSAFWLGKWMPSAFAAWQLSPMQLHAALIALFASIVAPFGGFFASGFKRAARLKDFGDVIPGHGGFTDRMDCQLLMGTFAYVYAHYFMGGYQAGPAAIAFHVSSIINSGMAVSDVEDIITQLTAHAESLRAAAIAMAGASALTA